MPHQRDIFTSGAILPDKTGHEWFGGSKAVKAAWEVVVQIYDRYVSSACFSPVQIINKMGPYWCAMLICK